MTTFDEEIKSCNCKKFDCQSKFSRDDQIKLRNEYWNIEKMEEKNLFLNKLMIRKPKASTTNIAHHKRERKFTVEYFLPEVNDKEIESTSDDIVVGHVNVRVCEQMFNLTFGITSKKVQVVLKKHQRGTTFQHASTGKKSEKWTKLHQEIVEKVTDHLKIYPTVSSHYRRKYSAKRYFEQDLTPTKIYKKFIKDNPDVKVSLSKFNIVLKRFDVKFFKPKNDQCSFCNKYKNSSKEPEITREYMKHHKRKDEARKQKDKDKERSISDPKFVAIIGDLEASRGIPKDKAGDFFYISKISCYNFSIFNLKDSKGTCYMWDQTIGKRGSNEIGSALKHYINNLSPIIEELVIYMDTCWGQNKNQYVAAMVLKEINCSDNLKSITFKFFESGHNQSEVDSIHSGLERALKSQNMFTPDQLKTIVEGSTNYTLIDLGSRSCPIFDLHKLNGKIIYNQNKYIVTNVDDSKRRVVSASWADAKLIYMENNSQVIQLSHNHSLSKSVEVDTSKKPITSRTRNNSLPSVSKKDLLEVTYQPLSGKKIAVPAKTVKGLHSLVDKGQIPNRYHDFFHSLESSNEENDVQ